MPLAKNHARVVVENVQPEIDGGRFAIKRVVGETVRVEADAFADGHDEISVALLHRKESDSVWTSVPMKSLGNDRWGGPFIVSEVGKHRYIVRAWVDHFKTWRRDLVKRLNAGQDVTVDLLIGANLVEEAAARAEDGDADILKATVKYMRGSEAMSKRAAFALDEQVLRLVSHYPDVRNAGMYERELSLWVDRERARYSTWYELFPRSFSPTPGQHGTFRDVVEQLPRLAEMGFDVLYLPPIHPVGRQFRKGKNNATTAQPEDVGSPWAIGGPEGGHTAIHPQLGTLNDFKVLVARANEQGMEIALDIAFQCAPDHPWVKEHPDWFRQRPDGTIQYAENPPKKYQDIYPIDFETPKYEALWEALKGVFLYWAKQGVKIFRVDNPHTKAFHFWEWCIDEVHRDYPDVLFLAEAFTRPKVMARLAKLGFSQSYTYFTWRNNKQELTEYFTELTTTQAREFFRPNVWPNTPDILHAYLQNGGKPAFVARLILAATLAASYGMYGPAFELCVNKPKEPGSEEYYFSEKYEIKQWDLASPESLAPLIARINRARREHPALQSNEGLVFHRTDNDNLLCYSKTTPGYDDVMLMVVNLDPHHRQWGFVDLAMDKLGLDWQQGFVVHDLLTDARYPWRGQRNYVDLNPHVLTAHVLHIRR